MCFYKRHFFHPYHLVDSDLGAFSSSRVLDCLEAAATNADKLNATRKFLEELEDYDGAMQDPHPENLRKAARRKISTRISCANPICPQWTRDFPNRNFELRKVRGVDFKIGMGRLEHGGFDGLARQYHQYSPFAGQAAQARSRLIPKAVLQGPSVTPVVDDLEGVA
jgi:hypothetical protein